MKTSGLVGKLLAGFASLLNVSKTQKFSIVVFEKGEVREIKEV